MLCSGGTMGVINNILKNLGLSDGQELRTYMPKPLPVSDGENKKQKPINTMTAIIPKSFHDIEKCVDSLRKGECSIIDLKSVNGTDYARIIDFLSGSCYALSAKLKRLQGDLFILVPSNINLNQE